MLRPGGLLHLDVPNHGGLAARIRTLPGVGAMGGGQRLAVLAAGRVGLGSLLVVVASRRGPD